MSEPVHPCSKASTIDDIDTRVIELSTNRAWERYGKQLDDAGVAAAVAARASGGPDAYRAKLESFDASGASALPGVLVVREGDLLGVVAGSADSVDLAPMLLLFKRADMPQAALRVGDALVKRPAASALRCSRFQRVVDGGGAMKLSRVRRVLTRRLAWLTAKAEGAPPGSALVEERDALETLLARENVRAVFLTPHHQFPTTAVMSPLAKAMEALSVEQLMDFASRLEMIAAIVRRRAEPHHQRRREEDRVAVGRMCAARRPHASRPSSRTTVMRGRTEKLLPVRRLRQNLSPI